MEIDFILLPITNVINIYLYLKKQRLIKNMILSLKNTILIEIILFNTQINYH